MTRSIPQAPDNFGAWCDKHKVTIADIEREAGVSQRTAYRYYNNESRLPRSAWIVLYRFVNEA